jgi:prepilin-type N-terminal cleavage/methylation domain-containing protein
MKLSRSKGFTLVEIMIVVAIIGIIIAIAVPAFLRARENSRGQACQENLTKVDGAKEQYSIEGKVGNGDACDFDALITPNIIPPGGTASVQAAVGEGYLRATPNCPAGGTYTVNVIGTAPTCDYAAPNWAIPHTLPQ